MYFFNLSCPDFLCAQRELIVCPANCAHFQSQMDSVYTLWKCVQFDVNTAIIFSSKCAFCGILDTFSTQNEIVSAEFYFHRMETLFSKMCTLWKHFSKMCTLWKHFDLNVHTVETLCSSSVCLGSHSGGEITSHHWTFQIYHHRRF